MHIIFLIKNFQLSRCGLSDYINIFSRYLKKKKIKTSILRSNRIVNTKVNSYFVDWKVMKVLKMINKSPENKIFFFQFSPFLQSRSGFSLKLLTIFFLLKFYGRNIKIITNFHETSNKFDISPKYLFMYLAHILQLHILIILSDRVYYTNTKFLNRFYFFKLAKCRKTFIFSNIQNKFNSKNRVSKNFTFYNSHFNKENLIKIFKLIKKYNHSNKKKIKLNFLGNSPSPNVKKTKKLLKNFSLMQYSKFYTNINERKFSKILNNSSFTIATRLGYFEENSGFHRASIVHNHYLLELNKNNLSRKYSYLKNIGNINNFDTKIDNFIKQLKKRNNNKKINITDEYIINNFIKDFSYILRV